MTYEEISERIWKPGRVQPTPALVVLWVMKMELVPKVTILPVVTSLDVPTERILDAAQEAELQGAFVIGVDKDGELYFASSFADGGTVLWWMEKAKIALMNVEYERRTYI
jgi:hypothetical protein